MTDLNYSKSLSMSSEDEYHYSDVEEEEEEEALQHQIDEEDDEEYQYSEEEDDASALKQTSINGRLAYSPTNDTSVSLHAQTSSALNRNKRKISATLSSAGNGSTSALMAARCGNGATGGNQDEYRVIDEQELAKEQHQTINEIASILELSFSTASILLRHFSWNKEKLFEGYYLDPAKARKDAGVQFADVTLPPLPPNQQIECLICCDFYPPSQVFGMGCHHIFCLNCWRPYLTLKIAEGPVCITTTCPAHTCKEIVSDQIFEKLVDPQEFRKYKRFVLRSFVDINRCIKWCPSPGCTKAISSTGGCSSVKCTCGCLFCLRCGEEAHSPVSCDQLALWQEKCRNESETANWILANTKKCPKCSVRIEKNQGCNHMTCRSCKYEFCWICMESWELHGTGTGGYYKCNRYDSSKDNAADSDAAKAKAELDRYLHYYKRYANHSEASKFAQRMRDGTEARMLELQKVHGDSSWIDVQFLNAATEQLIECRRVLKYTYVMGYYLPEGKEKNLFEYLQENLEKNTEHLTDLSEMPMEKMDRAEVINFTRVTERFLKNLLAGVEDGLTSNATLVAE